jgi:hypothetical protein
MDLLSYPIGSMVKVDDPIFSQDEIGVITDVSLDDGVLEYGVEGNAWFTHEQLTLVSLPTKRSIKRASKLLDEEE